MKKNKKRKKKIIKRKKSQKKVKRSFKRSKIKKKSKKRLKKIKKKKVTKTPEFFSKIHFFTRKHKKQTPY